MRLLLFILFCLTLTSSYSFACFIPGDPWYEANIELDTSSLPNDVQYDSGKFVVSSSQPFYFSGGEFGHHKPEPLEFPAELIDTPLLGSTTMMTNIFKVEEDIVYEWLGTDAAGWTWKEPYWGFEFNIGLLSSLGITNPYCPKYSTNAIICGISNRPEDVVVPDPQQFSILAYYNEKPLEIRGTIYYSLYPHYRTSDQKNCGGGIYLLAVVVVLVTGFIVYLSLKKRRLHR